MIFQTPSSQFIQLIQNNIIYYQQQVDEQPDDFLSTDQQNIHRAVLMGLQVVETVDCATNLLQDLTLFIELWGAWRKWIPLWQRSLEIQSDSAKRWQIQTQLAFFYEMNGDHDISITLLQEVLVHLSPEEEAERGKVNFHLGNSYFSQKQYNKARQHAQIAHSIFEKTPDATRGGTAPADNMLGLINQYTGNMEAAIQGFQKARQKWQHSGHMDYVFLTWINEAQIHEARQQYDAAMNCYQQAVHYSETSNRLFSKAQVYLNLGTLYSQQEKWQDAKSTYLMIDANTLYQQGYIDLYARLITNLGHTLMELGTIETAVSYLQEAVSLWRQLEDTVMLANALDSLGDVNRHLNKSTIAQDCYQEGLSIVLQHPDDYIAQYLQTTFTKKLAGL